MLSFRIILTGLLLLGFVSIGLGGETPPGEPPPSGEEKAAPKEEGEPGGEAKGDEGEPKEEPKPAPSAEGNGRAAEGVELSLGSEGSAQLQFADGTNVEVKENSKAKVSREKKGEVQWSFLSFEEGIFQVEGQNGPVEYILPGINVLGVGAKFQVTIVRGDRIEVELVNEGPGSVVATDVLTDMQILLEAGTGISASVDLGGGKTEFTALPGNTG
ncbi:MAG: hypothetical protein ACYTHN_24250, partial [Planctomycetota bacterium]